MTTFTRNLRLTAIALCAWGAGVFAAEKEAASAPTAKDSAAQKTEAAKSAKDAKANQQTVRDQAEKQAKDFTRDHDALVKQLNAAATEDQKKAVRERMKEREKEFQEKLNALRTLLRDEERKQRQNSGSRK
jgi:hypothetical protein